MDLHWSIVELAKSSMIVCENVGTLSVRLIRTGNLGASVFVSIEAQDRTTKIGEDYSPSKARQVQFDPGKHIANNPILCNDGDLFFMLIDCMVF